MNSCHRHWHRQPGPTYKGPPIESIFNQLSHDSCPATLSNFDRRGLGACWSRRMLSNCHAKTHGTRIPWGDGWELWGMTRGPQRPRKSILRGSCTPGLSSNLHTSLDMGYLNRGFRRQNMVVLSKSKSQSCGHFSFIASTLQIVEHLPR